MIFQRIVVWFELDFVGQCSYLVGNLVSLATVVYCLVLYTGFSFFGARHQCAGPVDGNWFQILLFKFGIDLLNSLVANLTEL